MRKSLTYIFAFSTAVGFVLVNLTSPYSTDMASATFTSYRVGGELAQDVATSGDYSVTAAGESYVSGRKTGFSFNLSRILADPGSAQAIAHELVLARGWDETEFACLYQLWARESGWRVNAGNPVSGAYGIPQALPGTKMASVAADWMTNPRTQIIWGLGYITGRYGTPCGAWTSWQSKGWY
ncbi:MAG: lytic transglycosylase domain-containing protein [Agromyces sp.]